MTPSAAAMVCMRVAECLHPLDGAIQRPCDDCQQSVWVSSSTRALADGLKVPVVWFCNQCALTSGLLDNPPQEMTEAQKQEIADATGLEVEDLDHEVAEAVWRSFHRGRGVPP